MGNPIQASPEKQISIAYMGESNDSVTTQLMGLSESFFQGKTALKQISKRVSYLIAESFQNIIRHGVPQNTETLSNPEPDFFQITFLADRIIISSKNLIEKENIQNLEDKINHINELSEEALKDIWRQTLNAGKLTPKGGAGLGVIDMARKSGLPLKKKFIHIDESFSQFYLGIEIINRSENREPKLDISEIVRQYNVFVNEGLLLSYSGDYSGETNSFLIQMLHNNLIDENNIDPIAIENLSIMIEVIQNISKHGARLEDQTPGSFSMYEKKGVQYINAHNYVDLEEYIAFKNTLQNIQSKDLAELKTERKKKMMEDSSSVQVNGGLGLIELGIFTESEFDYSFEKTEGDLYLFSIALKLKRHG